MDINLNERANLYTFLDKIVMTWKVLPTVRLQKKTKIGNMHLEDQQICCLKDNSITILLSYCMSHQHRLAAYTPID